MAAPALRTGPAKPQSRLASRLPKENLSRSPSFIRASDIVTFRVTKFSPRRGDSWLNMMPDAMKYPRRSRYPFTKFRYAFSFATAYGLVAARGDFSLWGGLVFLKISLVDA